MNSTLKDLLGKAAGEVEGLDPKEQQQLLEHLTEAKKVHEQRLNQAMLDALDHLPWIVRGPIKKIFGL